MMLDSFHISTLARTQRYQSHRVLPSVAWMRADRVCVARVLLARRWCELTYSQLFMSLCRAAL